MEDYMIYEVYDDILYIPRGIRTWLANRPVEKKIFEEWLVQKRNAIMSIISRLALLGQENMDKGRCILRKEILLFTQMETVMPRKSAGN